MKLKNIVAGILSLVMTMTLLAGCSGGQTAGTTDVSGGSTGGDANWPTKTVTVTVPYNAGGDTDIYCRLMAQRLEKKFGQNFIIVNMTGGSGIVASKHVMAQAPDGYNILFTHTGASLVQEATGVADFSYTDDFETVATVAQDNSYTLVVKADSGWETLEDMIAYAKANPGELRYSQVYGSATHYVCSQIESTMGIELNKLDVGTGTAERLAAFMGNQVDLLAVNYMNIADYIENGDFIALGVAAPERCPGMEDVPTFIEQGYHVVSQKNYEVKFPKGTDEAIVELLSEAIEEITQDEVFAEELLKYYAEPFYRSSEDSVLQDRAEVQDLIQAFADME